MLRGAGAGSIMRSSGAGEVVKFRSRPMVDQIRNRTRSKNWERLTGNVHFWPQNATNDALLGGERVLSCDHHAASFVACFVTMECATSLDRDPTILISCQS